MPTGNARTEIRLDPTGTQTTVPKELSTLVTGVRRGKALRHIVTVRTDRTVHRLLDADDELVVEVADDHVDAVAPGRGAATLSSWREIEAELGPAGTEDTLTAVGGALTGAGREPVGEPEQGRQGARHHRHHHRRRIARRSGPDRGGRDPPIPGRAGRRPGHR